MPLNYVRKCIPKKEDVLACKSMRLFGNLVHRPGLWHVNRKTVSRAAAIGLFFAFLPIPFQMVLAMAGAVFFQANAPLSVALVWITNPFTMPPIFYGAFVLGSWVTGYSVSGLNFSNFMPWLQSNSLDAFLVFLSGCLIFSLSFSLIGFVSVRLFYFVNAKRVGGMI